MEWMKMKGRILIAVTALAVFAGGCVVSRNPVTGNKRAYGYSWQQEVELGRTSDAQIVSLYGLYDDDLLSSFVDSLGQKLVSVSHLRRPGAEPEWKRTEFHFRLLDSPVINAFALPGGYIYVTRGLLAHLENEAQLAVVIGHEIGHVAGRHASKRAAKQVFSQALLVGGAIGGQVFLGGDAAANILNVGGAATQLLFLSYGRDDERESDDLGVEYASMLGYDASLAAGFFRTLKRLGDQSGSDIPSFMSTHPDPGEREKTILRLASEWAAQMPVEKVRRNSYLRRLNGLVYGENPRQGFVRNGTFYHPDLAFQFPVPVDYQVLNQPQQVVLISKAKDAVVLLRQDTSHQTAKEAAEAYAGQQGITVIESGVGSAHGLPARYVVADATGSDGQELRLRAHFIDYKGQVYAFTGLSSRDSFDTYDRHFQSTMKGFQELTDNRILATQPDRVSIQISPSSVSFVSAVPGKLPDGVTPTDLAILNQMEMSDVLQKGQLIKLVR